jgi:hypothetical protein
MSAILPIDPILGVRRRPTSQDLWPVLRTFLSIAALASIAGLLILVLLPAAIDAALPGIAAG